MNYNEENIFKLYSINNERFLGDRLIMSLSENIKCSIDFWQKSIEGNLEGMTQEEQINARNIFRWHRNAKKNTYRNNRVYLKDYHKQIIEKHKTYEYYNFKKLIEILVRKLVKDYFSNIPGSAIVYNTSDSDDIFAGIDLILCIGQDFYGIDICCTESSNTINEKLKKYPNVIPIEFNLYKNIDPITEIPRLIFPIPYKVISNFIELSMSEISKTGSLQDGKALEYFIDSGGNEKGDLLSQIIRRDTKDKIEEIFN